MSKRKLGDASDSQCPSQFVAIDYDAWRKSAGKALKTVLIFDNCEVVGKATVFENGNITMSGEVTDEILGKLLHEHFKWSTSKLKKKIG